MIEITGNIKTMHSCVYMSLGWANRELKWGGWRQWDQWMIRWMVYNEQGFVQKIVEWVRACKRLFQEHREEEKKTQQGRASTGGSKEQTAVIQYAFAGGFGSFLLHSGVGGPGKGRNAGSEAVWSGVCEGCSLHVWRLTLEEILQWTRHGWWEHQLLHSLTLDITLCFESRYLEQNETS